jgi:hypothetical protein
MDDGLIIERETIEIEGGRNLYNYTFHDATPEDRLMAMIEGGELGVIGPFLDQHPHLDLSAALVLARGRKNEEAIRELSQRAR